MRRAFTFIWVIAISLAVLFLIATLRPKPSVDVARAPLDHAALARTVYFTTQYTVESTTYCSAAAVGPHALLTATHCELGTDVVSLGEGKDVVKAHIEGHIRDADDHSIYLLSGVKFRDYAEINQTAPAQGTRVFMWGNPGDERNMYREGVVAGTQMVDKVLATMIDMRVDHGDSGAPVFDADGRIVGVIYGVFGSTNMRLMDMLPFKFTPAQLRRAKEF